ncbi:MAG: hypothetical protein ACLT8E_09285 [Akkermansia sp.]
MTPSGISAAKKLEPWINNRKIINRKISPFHEGIPLPWKTILLYFKQKNELLRMIDEGTEHAEMNTSAYIREEGVKKTAIAELG